MKLSRIERIYSTTLIVILVGIVFHAPLSVGLGVLLPDYDLLIKSWKEILMVALIPLACYIATRHRLWGELKKDWIFRLIVSYTILHIVFVLLAWQVSGQILAGLAIDLRYILFFSLMYVAIKALPSARRSMLIATLFGMFVVVLFATLQLFLPADILAHIGYSKETIMPYLTVDRNPDYIRVNSTLRGPNPLGAYAGMVLALLTAALVKGKIALSNKRIAVSTATLGGCAAIALWISYSRSALVAGIVAVFIALFAATMGKTSRRTWIASGVILCVIAAGLVVARDTGFVSNVLLHENQNGGSEISSNDGHIDSLEYGISQLVREPLGSGIGSTGSASLLGDNPVIVENQFLFIGHETGWIGLIIFSVLYVIIMYRLWRSRKDWLSLGVFASGVGLGLIGLLLPVWADDTVSIIWWGVAAIALAGGKYERRKTK